MFKRLDTINSADLFFTFEGTTLNAREGDTVAAALLLNKVSCFRLHPVSGEPRSAWCMMGACYECLVEVDGRRVQACMTKVENGLAVSRIDSAADIPLSEHYDD